MTLDLSKIEAVEAEIESRNMADMEASEHGD